MRHFLLIFILLLSLRATAQMDPNYASWHKEAADTGTVAYLPMCGEQCETAYQYQTI